MALCFECISTYGCCCLFFVALVVGLGWILGFLAIPGLGRNRWTESSEEHKEPYYSASGGHTEPVGPKELEVPEEHKEKTERYYSASSGLTEPMGPKEPGVPEEHKERKVVYHKRGVRPQLSGLTELREPKESEEPQERKERDKQEQQRWTGLTGPFQFSEEHEEHKERTVHKHYPRSLTTVGGEGAVVGSDIPNTALLTSDSQGAVVHSVTLNAALLTTGGQTDPMVVFLVSAIVAAGLVRRRMRS